METMTDQRLDCGACRMFADFAVKHASKIKPGESAICGPCYDDGLMPLVRATKTLRYDDKTSLVPVVAADNYYREAGHMAEIPKGAKAPADRKPKTTPKPDVQTAKAGGREWTIPAGALDDFELLDDLGQIEQGNPARLPSVLRRLIGDQWPDAMDSIRDKDSGRVGVEAGAEFVREIMESLDPNS